MSHWISSIESSARQGLSSASHWVDQEYHTLKHDVQSAEHSVTSAVSSAGHSVGAALSSAEHSVVHAATSAGKELEHLAQQAPDAIKSAGIAVVGGIEYAEDHILPSSGTLLAGEAGLVILAIVAGIIALKAL